MAHIYAQTSISLELKIGYIQWPMKQPHLDVSWVPQAYHVQNGILKSPSPQ